MIMTKELLDEIELISDALLQEIIDRCCAEAVDAVEACEARVSSCMRLGKTSVLVFRDDATQAIKKRLKGDV